MSLTKEQVMSMTTLPDVLARLYHDWKAGNNKEVITLEELGEINKFMTYVDGMIDSHRVVNLKHTELSFERLFNQILQKINEKYDYFKLSFREKPVISASSASMHFNAQLTVQLVDPDIKAIYVPLNYNYDNWKLLSEDNIESEILTTVSSSIIRSLKHDLKITVINPNNFTKFNMYNLNIVDYFYNNEEVVLEISSLIGSDQVYLYYTWNVVDGIYKRKGSQSSLAQMHLRNKSLAERLQE